MITFETIRKCEDIKVYISCADDSLRALGYTEHSFSHASIVSSRCAEILTKLGFDTKTVELSKIAGYMHDIGNLVIQIENLTASRKLAPYSVKDY